MTVPLTAPVPLAEPSPPAAPVPPARTVPGGSGDEPLESLVGRGLALVDTRLAATGGAVYRSLRAQLRYVRRLVETGERPTAVALDRLTMGVYAAREFETSDPELAEILFVVEYRAKRL